MDQPFYLREQAERCHRLARDCTDPMLRDSLLKLAEEYMGRPAPVKMTKRQFGRPAQARMTRTLTDRLAAIGAAINHERQEYARSTHEPASLALAG